VIFLVLENAADAFLIPPSGKFERFIFFLGRRRRSAFSALGAEHARVRSDQHVVRANWGALLLQRDPNRCVDSFDVRLQGDERSVHWAQGDIAVAGWARLRQPRLTNGEEGFRLRSWEGAAIRPATALAGPNGARQAHYHPISPRRRVQSPRLTAASVSEATSCTKGAPLFAPLPAR